jgi:hypothetical protein
VNEIVYDDGEVYDEDAYDLDEVIGYGSEATEGMADGKALANLVGRVKVVGRRTKGVIRREKVGSVPGSMCEGTTLRLGLWSTKGVLRIPESKWFRRIWDERRRDVRTIIPEVYVRVSDEGVQQPIHAVNAWGRRSTEDP